MVSPPVEDCVVRGNTQVCKAFLGSFTLADVYYKVGVPEGEKYIVVYTWGYGLIKFDASNSGFTRNYVIDRGLYGNAELVTYHSQDDDGGVREDSYVLLRANQVIAYLPVGVYKVSAINDPMRKKKYKYGLANQTINTIIKMFRGSVSPVMPRIGQRTRSISTTVVYSRNWVEEMIRTVRYIGGSAMLVKDSQHVFRVLDIYDPWKVVVAYKMLAKELGYVRICEWGFDNRTHPRYRVAHTLTKALADVGYLNDQVKDPKLERYGDLICLSTDEIPDPPKQYVVVFLQEKSPEELVKDMKRRNMVEKFRFTL